MSISTKTAARGALISLVGHLAVAAVMAYAAWDSRVGDSATSFWLLAGFAALGAASAFIMWLASLRQSGRPAPVTILVLLLLGVAAVLALLASVRLGSASVFVSAALLTGLNVVVLRRIPPHPVG